MRDLDLRDIKDFVMINIYILLGVNFIIFSIIYYLIFKGKLSEKWYRKTKSRLKKHIYKYIKGETNIRRLRWRVNSSYKKMVAIDVINEYTEGFSKDGRAIIEKLKLDTFLIKKIKKNPDIKYFKKLALMRVSSSYDSLLKYTDSEELDIKYICYYGLSILNISKEKKYDVVMKLIGSDILKDRVIEILNNIDITFDEWLFLLERDGDEKRKEIFLKVLSGRKELKESRYSDRLLRYLNENKEVKIAAISTLSSSENDKYAEYLYNLFKAEKEWEVKAAIANGMANFSATATKEKLLYMIRDDEWWVRFNAAKSISLMGEEGVYTLIELSIDKDNENVAALAYYFLNSNKDVYETVKSIEE